MMAVEKAFNIAGLRAIAMRKLPRMIFDYIDGGAEDEVTLRRQVSRFEDYELLWRVLQNVTEIDTSATVLGAKSALPFFIAPTATMRLFHPKEGELALARAAEAAGIPFAVSTLASQSLEAIAEAAPTVGKFIQVYVWKDRELVAEFLRRAKAAGFQGCILTVDAPLAGMRERDLRNGFAIPPSITPKTVSQILSRPGYLANIATSPPIGPENFAAIDFGDRDVAKVIRDLFDASMTWEDAAWMIEEWGGPFAIKGISRLEDAVRAVEIGASAVWVTNHGGRQLDTAVPVIDLVPEIRDAVGKSIEIIADGGVRRGSHALKLIARGADIAATGRATLYGLAAGGQAGVARAIDILAQDCQRTLALLGATSLAKLNKDLVRLRQG